MFRSFAKRLFSTTNAPRDMYERHAITVCSVIAYTTVLSVAHRDENTKQYNELLKELKELKKIQNEIEKSV
jgi:agmatine/peptidylarginine deiminase